MHGAHVRICLVSEAHICRGLQGRRRPLRQLPKTLQGDLGGGAHMQGYETREGRPLNNLDGPCCCILRTYGLYT